MTGYDRIYEIFKRLWETGMTDEIEREIKTLSPKMSDEEHTIALLNIAWLTHDRRKRLE